VARIASAMPSCSNAASMVARLWPSAVKTTEPAPSSSALTASAVPTSAAGAPVRTPIPTPTRARSRRVSPASRPWVARSATIDAVSTATSGTSPPSMRRRSAAAVL